MPTLKSISLPALARLHGRDTYKGERCSLDGTREKYTHNHKCVECAVYLSACTPGRIVGVDGRTEAQKAGLAPLRGNNEKWCDEMSHERSEAIKRGKRRKAKT